MGIAALHDTCEAVKQQQKQHFKTILSASACFDSLGENQKKA